MLRSGCGPIPVSTIATSASTRSSVPLMFATGEYLPPIRETPFGMVCPVRWMISSGTIAATFGSVRRALRWFASSEAVKPRKARANVRSARTSARVATRLTAAVVFVPDLSTTMYRPVASRPPLTFGRADGSSGMARGSTAGVAARVGVTGATGAAVGALGCGAGVGSGLAGGAGSAEGAGWVLAVGSADGVGLGSAALAVAATGRTISVASKKAASRRRMGTPLERASEEHEGNGCRTPCSSHSVTPLGNPANGPLVPVGPSDRS